jgi:hypothetical protein
MTGIGQLIDGGREVEKRREHGSHGSRRDTNAVRAETYRPITQGQSVIGA